MEKEKNSSSRFSHIYRGKEEKREVILWITLWINTPETAGFEHFSDRIGDRNKKARHNFFFFLFFCKNNKLSVFSFCNPERTMSLYKLLFLQSRIVTNSVR